MASKYRGRRARFRLRTLARWPWYYETTPVYPDEILLRAVPNNPSYIDPSMGAWTVDPYAFSPRKIDVDGISLFREDFTSPERLARWNRHRDGVHVARLAASLLLELELEIVPKPEDNLPPGHVVIPKLKYLEKNAKTEEERERYKKEKRRLDDISQRLAQVANANPIYTPPGLSPIG